MRNRERFDLKHVNDIFDKENPYGIRKDFRYLDFGYALQNPTFKKVNKMHNFEINEKDGSVTQYAIDHNGVIKQLYPKPFKYDDKYVGIYDDPERVRKSEALQRLRFGFIEAMSDGPIESLIDIGYGNGAFLESVKATKVINSLYGYDIAGVDPPRGVTFIEDWIHIPVDVMTMWDVFEHFPDLSFIEEVNARMLIITTPWCKFNPYETSTFKDWFHRKPNEHLHFFNPESLTKTMKMYGWNCIGSSNFEDMVRRRGRNNILTAAFTR